MDIEAGRDLFVRNSRDYWSAISNGLSEKANKVERSTQKLVNQWHAANVAVDILTALLGDSAPEVRFFAAAYLVGLDGSSKSRAVTVLEEIRSQDTGLMAVSAATILQVRGLGSA